MLPHKKRLRSIKKNRQSGFSLFEMVVAISSIVILYMVAEQRLNDLPAAAERASFIGVLEQIKTGVHIEMISRITKGNSGKLKEMEGENPMDYLLERPSNYLGEQVQVSDQLRRRNAWYFETSTQELVYLVGGSNVDNVWVSVATVPVNLGQLRFKVQAEYSSSKAEEGVTETRNRKMQGILLKPVYEYSWESRADLQKSFIDPIVVDEQQSPVQGG